MGVCGPLSSPIAGSVVCDWCPPDPDVPVVDVPHLRPCFCGLHTDDLRDIVEADDE